MIMGKIVVGGNTPQYTQWIEKRDRGDGGIFFLTHVVMMMKFVK